MAPRNTQLPEGTDHIIQGAMATAETRARGGGDDKPLFAGVKAGEESMVEQLKGHAGSLRGQAENRIRDIAVSGKTRATGALDEVSKLVGDAADSIDERLGTEAGDYARKASDAVSGLADTLRRKEVDELYDDAREAVRKSPGIAIGVAAVVGFTLIRLVKAGLSNDGKKTDA